MSNHQWEIREYGGKQYSITEGANIIKELNERTQCGDAEYNTIEKISVKLEPLVREDLKKSIDNINLRLSWGKKFNGADSYRIVNEHTLSSEENANNSIIVYDLISHIDEVYWEKIKNYSPKIRVERYSYRKRRTNNTQRESGFKYDANYLKNFPQRKSLVDVTDKDCVLDINPEYYFRLDNNFPILSGRSVSNKRLYKQLLQFRIEITVGEEKIVSEPIGRIIVMARRENNDNGNVVSYSLR